MTQSLHTAGHLDVSDVVHRQIVQIHVLEDSQPEQTLPAEAVRAVEEKLDVRIPDDILAIMASRSELFCKMCKMQLELVLDHQEAVKASDGPVDVFAVGEQPDKHGYYVIEDAWETPPFLLEYDAGQRSLSPWALETWMERKIGNYQSYLLLEGDTKQQERAGRVPSREQLESFEPHLT